MMQSKSQKKQAHPLMLVVVIVAILALVVLTWNQVPRLAGNVIGGNISSFAQGSIPSMNVATHNVMWSLFHDTGGRKGNDSVLVCTGAFRINAPDGVVEDESGQPISGFKRVSFYPGVTCTQLAGDTRSGIARKPIELGFDVQEVYCRPSHSCILAGKNATGDDGQCRIEIGKAFNRFYDTTSQNFTTQLQSFQNTYGLTLIPYTGIQSGCMAIEYSTELRSVCVRPAGDDDACTVAPLVE